MPKMKTHKGAKKRFKLTGTGKLRRRQANLGHIMEKFSATRERRLTGDVNVAKADEKAIKRLLGQR
jgi:large subunit ribosomal protein L35